MKVERVYFTKNVDHEQPIGAAAGRLLEGGLAVGEAGDGRKGTKATFPQKVSGVRDRVSEVVYGIKGSQESPGKGGSSRWREDSTTNKQEKHRETKLSRCRHHWGVGVGLAGLG
ncbi:hypothetical protein ACLOJK_037218 [Asimina triloba]